MCLFVCHLIFYIFLSLSWLLLSPDQKTPWVTGPHETAGSMKPTTPATPSTHQGLWQALSLTPLAAPGAGPGQHHAQPVATALGPNPSWRRCWPVRFDPAAGTLGWRKGWSPSEGACCCRCLTPPPRPTIPSSPRWWLAAAAAGWRRRQSPGGWREANHHWPCQMWAECRARPRRCLGEGVSHIQWVSVGMQRSVSLPYHVGYSAATLLSFISGFHGVYLLFNFIFGFTWADSISHSMLKNTRQHYLSTEISFVNPPNLLTYFGSYFISPITSTNSTTTTTKFPGTTVCIQHDKHHLNPSFTCHSSPPVTRQMCVVTNSEQQKNILKIKQLKTLALLLFKRTCLNNWFFCLCFAMQSNAMPGNVAINVF